MKATASVVTTNVRSMPSRGRVDHATVRAQFEAWLAEIAEDIDKDRGERLRVLLNRSPLTRRALADAVGVEQRTVQRWLKGKGIAPQNREPLAEALGRSVAYIMHGELEGPDPHDILGRLDAIDTALQENTAQDSFTYGDLANLANQQNALMATMREMVQVLAEILDELRGGGEGNRRRA